MLFMGSSQQRVKLWCVVCSLPKLSGIAEKKEFAAEK